MQYAYMFFSFNSILVRLKVEARRRGYFSRVGFNSILVRLKDDQYRETATEIICFNSILVRLKAPAGSV